MSERTAQKLSIPAVVAIAMAVVIVYTLWGASLLAAERAGFAASQPTVSIHY